MASWITCISICLVLWFQNAYINFAFELFVAKYRMLAAIFAIVGIAGIVLCFAAIKNIVAMHIIVILNFLLWTVFYKSGYEAKK